METKYLLTPGPVELPAEVLRAGSKPLIGHRSPAFSELLMKVEGKLCSLLRSEGPVIILPSSGTGALESLALNLLGPGTKFLSLSCGVFGDRFREIAQKTGSEGVACDFEFGEPVTPAAAAEVLRSQPEVDAVLLTQNETSTGVLNPIKEISEAMPADNRPLILVDGVSSVGAMPCFPEEWGVDGIATASQKGLLTPPGLGFVWLSKRAWKIAENKNCSSYTYDLKLHRKFLERSAPSNPFTPPVSLYYALDAALDLILDKGPDNWFEERMRYARALAAGLEALGFKLLVKDARYRSPGVTAFFSDSDDCESIRNNLRIMGVEAAGGQGKRKGKLIRVAHYGDFGWPELCLTLGSLYGASPFARESSGFLEEAWEVWNAVCK